jgi:hypothetical protein
MAITMSSSMLPHPVGPTTGEGSDEAWRRRAPEVSPVTARRRWAALLRGSANDAGGPLVDIGSSVLTGVRDRRAEATRSAGDLVAHPVQCTRLLGVTAARAVHSDFVRTGFVHPFPQPDADGSFHDALGVRWLWCDGEPAPLDHPLTGARPAEIVALGAPPVPTQLVAPSATDDLLTVADAAAPGLVEFCSAVRGPWSFLEDVAGDRTTAAALLDRALEHAVACYETLLRALPSAPDLVLVTDDLGYADSMFLAASEHRDLVAPRMRDLVTAIRGWTDAPLGLGVSGAVAAILPDLLDLGVQLLDVQHDARGLDPAELRRSLPATTVLHGVTDLVELGRAVAVGEMATIANAVYQFARTAPAVAAPVGSLDLAELPDAVVGGRFLAALTADDLALVRRAGPVRSVITRCLDAARDIEIDTHDVAVPSRLDVAVVGEV